MKQFALSTVLMGALLWLGVGCDIGSDQPQKAVRHHPKPTAKQTAPAPKKKEPKSPKETLPGSSEYLDVKNGFRDAAFGQSEAEFNNLVLKEKNEALQTVTYTRTGDVLSLENMPLETIEYVFFKGRLSRITLKWRMEYRESVLANPPSTELAASCSNLYGKPKQHSNQKDCTRYAWTGRKVEIVMYEFRIPGVANPAKRGSWSIPPSTSGQMDFSSIPLRRELDLLIASKAQSEF